MSRPSTAVREWDVPGRPGKPVRLHPPKPGGRSWRVTYYDADGRARERTAVGRDAAEALATGLVASLRALQTAPHAAATIADLAAVYMGRFADAKGWSAKYRQERRFAYRWLPDAFTGLRCLDWEVLRTEDVLAAVAAAGYPYGCEEYRRVGALLSGLRTAGWKYGYLPRDRDPLDGVRYNPPRRTKAQAALAGERPSVGNVQRVPDALIPDAADVDALAEAVVQVTGCWWEGLRVRLMAYGGLRFGEQADLRADQVSADPDAPWIHVIRQAVAVPVQDGRPSLLVGQSPKHGILRWSFYDDRLCEDLARRVDEAGPGGLVLPTAGGSLCRESNYMRDVWNPAARSLGWARVEDLPGRPPGSKKSGWLWTPHSLRHRYATWLIRELGVEPFNVSEWMGHSDTTITLTMYVDTSVPDVSAGVRAVRAQRERDRGAATRLSVAR